MARSNDPKNSISKMKTNLFNWLGALLLMQQVATAGPGLYSAFFNDGSFQSVLSIEADQYIL